MDGLKEMVHAVGVEHISIGSDHLPAETAKIGGGNYLRIFAASAG